jgi:hypothetical protein
VFSLKEHARRWLRGVVRTALSVLEEPPQRHLYSETRQHDIHAEIDRLKAEIRESTPDNIVLSGYKVFSQFDEDGIIQAMLARLPADRLSRTAIEIGCGDGLENNTHFLLLKGFSACWIDGSPKNIAAVRRGLGMTADAKTRLRVTERFVTTDAIEAVIDESCAFLGVTDPDFFSLDIDGNDLHVLVAALGSFSPKIICVEYNGKFPPPVSLAIRYDPAHSWAFDDYQGASLQAFCDVLTGYTLITCNIAGANAFFVRNDFSDRFPSYPVEKLFRPLRGHLRLWAAGHPPSLKWLRNSLESVRSPPLHAAPASASTAA